MWLAVLANSIRLDRVQNKNPHITFLPQTFPMPSCPRIRGIPLLHCSLMCSCWNSSCNWVRCDQSRWEVIFPDGRAARAVVWSIWLESNKSLLKNTAAEDNYTITAGVSGKNILVIRFCSFWILSSHPVKPHTVFLFINGLLLIQKIKKRVLQT